MAELDVHDENAKHSTIRNVHSVLNVKLFSHQMLNKFAMIKSWEQIDILTNLKTVFLNPVSV